MKKSLKGALLSGLVFPGYGQFVMKHYMRGFALVIISFSCLVVIGMKVLQQALVVLENIEYGGGAIDMSAVLNAVDLLDTSSNDVTYKFASLLLLLCWIIGIIDAYRSGWRKDPEEQRNQC